MTNYVDEQELPVEVKFKDLLWICRKYLDHDMTKAQFKEIVEVYYPREGV